MPLQDGEDGAEREHLGQCEKKAQHLEKLEGGENGTQITKPGLKHQGVQDLSSWV